MIHPMPPEDPRSDILDLAVFIGCMVATVLVTGFLAWIYVTWGRP